MDNQKEVYIELVNGTLNDYVIKDKDKILIGRFAILELDKEHKRCSVKLKFYREKNYDLLKDSLKLILKVIFKDNNVFKVNFIVNENPIGDLYRLSLSGSMRYSNRERILHIPKLFVTHVKNEINHTWIEPRHCGLENFDFSKYDFNVFRVHVMMI